MWLLFLRSVLADAPSDLQTGGEQQITVATLNTWGLPSPVARDRRGRLPLIASWLRERSYDLTGLEELWQGARRWLLFTELVFPAQRGDSGLAIVTDWPLYHTVSHVFGAERGIDSWKAKGLLAAEVRIDETALRFGVTHLQSGGGVRNAAVRALQVDEILETLDEGFPGTGDVPVVLLGDFNLYDDIALDQRTRSVLEEAGFVDVAVATGTLGPTYPGMPDRFDRVWVRQTATTAIVPRQSQILAKGFSDHHALEATLGIESMLP